MYEENKRLIIRNFNFAIAIVVSILFWALVIGIAFGGLSSNARAQDFSSETITPDGDVYWTEMHDGSGETITPEGDVYFHERREGSGETITPDGDVYFHEYRYD